VSLRTGSSLAGSHDPVFVSISALPSSCEVFANSASTEYGITQFSNVKLLGFIGNCTLSFHAHFAGGQKAVSNQFTSAISRAIISPVIAPLSPISTNVTANVPFTIPREFHFFA
jgi:hypothetical protein